MRLGTLKVHLIHKKMVAVYKKVPYRLKTERLVEKNIFYLITLKNYINHYEMGGVEWNNHRLIFGF